MMNFDSPNREQCAVVENRTNSPLQALDLMNDATFVEAARKLAERMLVEGGATPQARIGYGYALLLARPPGPRQAQVLARAFDQFAAEFVAEGPEFFVRDEVRIGYAVPEFLLVEFVFPIVRGSLHENGGVAPGAG